MIRRRPALAWVAAAAAALAVALFAGWWQVDGPGARRPNDLRPLPLSAMQFSLTDDNGRAAGPHTLIGRPTMLFLGFTYCPDVCPTTLADISGWLEALGPAAAQRINAVFLTVDPKRDDRRAMADYVAHFHPAIRGLTGPAEQIDRLVQGLRADYRKVPLEAGGYTMDHTASVFLFDAAGGFVTTIDAHEPREFALPKIRRAMGDPQ